MRNNEFRRKETIESQSDTKSSMKSEDSSSKSYIERAKNGIGIAFAGALKAAEATMKITTAGLAIQAGLGIRGVEGSSTPGSGTDLQVRGDYHPSKVPAYFIQQERLAQIEKQAQTLRAVAEKTNKNPEFARKLLETWKEKRQNKGTERLTPEKIDPEVWESVGRMLTERRELNDNTGTTVVLVHGFVGNGVDPVNCKGGYWGDAINYLKAQGYSDCRTVKFYNSDINCDVDLHDSIYAGPCSQYAQGSEGTNNESLDHVSCLLAQYLYQNFGKSNQKVILVGHSMGGILIRNTMYLTQVNNESPVIPTPFPPSIGTVTDAVTFNSPHGGVPSVGGLADLVACGNCKQVAELTSGSDFMNSLGLYPQVPGGATRWTIVGSECDLLVSSVSAISMNADQAVVYSTRGKSDNTYDNTCYDHGGALHDGSVINNAIQYTCSTGDLVNSPCGTAYASTNGPWTVGQGPRGLQELYNAASS